MKGISDPSLRFIVLSCIDSETESLLKETVVSIRKLRPDVKIIAGGPLGERIGADATASSIAEVLAIMKHSVGLE